MSMHWRDRNPFVGFLVAVVVLGGYALISGSALQLLNVSGLFIVVGGTRAAALVQFSVPELRQAWSMIVSSFYEEAEPLRARMAMLIGLSRQARKSGLVSVEKDASQQGDTFLSVALQLAVDQVPEAELRNRLNAEIRLRRKDYEHTICILEALATYAPAFGLVGTLLGLTSMFSQLSDSASLTSGMAVAVLTTLYGILMANLFFLPFAGKIRTRILHDETLCRMTLEAVVSLAKEENTVFLEQRLLGFRQLAVHS